MPCIHPSESPPLGWLVPCLAVKDIEASVEWYGKLDLVPYGGAIEEKWSMLRNRAIEIHLFEGHIPEDLLNFRGGDLLAIRAALTERGLVVGNEQDGDSHGYFDPDGRECYFDSSPGEMTAYEAGHPLTGSFEGDDVHAGSGLDLGNLTCCLACEDLAATTAFYETLGLVASGGDPDQGFTIMGRVDHPPAPGRRLVTTYLSLFEGRIPSDVLNFRGGNVAAIAEALADGGADVGNGVTRAPDGGESLLLSDPDGRGVFLDTTPPERLAAI